MKSLFLPTADNPAYQWLAFILFLLLFCICVGGFVVWLVKSKSNRAKRKRRHRHHRPTNPTLAQTGGLPPRHEADRPPPGP